MTDDLRSEVSELRRLVEAQAEEIARLAGRPLPNDSAHRSDRAELPQPAPPTDTDGTEQNTHLSRRGALLALGGAAAGGVGLALGSAFMGAEPAAADDLPILGGVTNLTTDVTVITASAESAFQGNASTDGESGVQGIDTSTGGGYGVYGESTAGPGVYGTLTSGTSGLLSSTGIFSKKTAVVGDTNGPTGVMGLSSSDMGVLGGCNANGGVGVYGQDVSPAGGSGVYGQSSNGGIGVFGEADAATGIALGAWNTAGGPTLQLLPAGSTTLPSTSSVGSFMVLSDGSLWYCYATNEWVQLNNGIVTLPAPVRVIDTTSSGGSVGGIAGPLVPGATIHTTSVLTGSNGIPAQALGVVGNFAISGVGGALLNGLGVATIFPAGVSTPATANINAGAGCFAISNAVTVRFGTGADAGKLAIVWGGGGAVPNVEAFFDVTGFIL